MPRTDTSQRLLQAYRAKRDFKITPEPPAVAGGSGQQLSFVVQKHHASTLHYDFRLELGGVLVSWAVPKGPSLDPADKRMAVRTEDHPLAYARFEGSIPAQQYGAGEVIVWDQGLWLPAGDPHAGLAQGKLGFQLQGCKLQGAWELVRMKARVGERQEAWLLFKKRDAHARPRGVFDVVQMLPGSVLTAGAAGTAAPLPQTLPPQLARLAKAVPDSGRWIFETKFDGYRLAARIEAGVPRLITRGGHDWTARLPVLAAELAALQVDSAWLDGEIVVGKSGGRGAGSGDAAGGGDFHALQTAFDGARTQHITYMLFDLPYFQGTDLRELPLLARRQLLQDWLAHAHTHDGAQHLQFSPTLGQGAGPQAASALQAALQAACRAGLEGVVAKREDAPYRSTRNGRWLKLKCQQRQEFVVAGYAARSDDPRAVGSLVLGVHDAQGRLQPAGSVGTGWDQTTARSLLQRLAKLATDTAPFDAQAQGAGRTRWASAAGTATQWVRPRSVVEVRFAEWTPAARVRHAVFVGLRSDKPAAAVVREG